MSHWLLSACGASQNYFSVEAGWAADGRPPSLHRTEHMSRGEACQPPPRVAGQSSLHRTEHMSRGEPSQKGFANGVKNATNHFHAVDWERVRSSPVAARESFLHAVVRHKIRE